MGSIPSKIITNLCKLFDDTFNGFWNQNAQQIVFFIYLKQKFVFNKYYFFIFQNANKYCMDDSILLDTSFCQICNAVIYNGFTRIFRYKCFYNRHI